jgi:hypothetical protein
MATPGQLVKCIADALGIPEPTVVLYDRLLAENGLRSKGGRGTSAAKVTPTDAANLIIAILGSPLSGASIKSAIETCEAYGRLPMRLGGAPENLRKLAALGFPTLAKLPHSHTLREALSALIEAAVEGEALIIPNDEDEDDPLIGPLNDPFVAVTLQGPEKWAEIIADASLGEGNPDETARFVYHRQKKTSGKRRKPTCRDDMTQTRRISFKTIRRVAELLAKGSVEMGYVRKVGES